MYGPLNTIVPADCAAQWLRVLIDQSRSEKVDFLSTMQLASRTDDRYRDIEPRLRDEVASWLEQHAASAHLVQLVRNGGSLDVEEQGQVYGESLPKGLRLAP